MQEELREHVREIGRQMREHESKKTRFGTYVSLAGPREILRRPRDNVSLEGDIDRARVEEC